MQSHFHTLPFGVDLILGMNGNIWVSKQVPVSEDGESMYSSKNDVRPAILLICCFANDAGDY